MTIPLLHRNVYTIVFVNVTAEVQYKWILISLRFDFMFYLIVITPSLKTDEDLTLNVHVSPNLDDVSVSVK